MSHTLSYHNNIHHLCTIHQGGEMGFLMTFVHSRRWAESFSPAHLCSSGPSPGPANRFVAALRHWFVCLFVCTWVVPISPYAVKLQGSGQLLKLQDGFGPGSHLFSLLFLISQLVKPFCHPPIHSPGHFPGCSVLTRRAPSLDFSGPLTFTLARNP